MNPDLSKLHPYPFEKLAQLKSQVTPPTHLDHIALSIGEPKHAAPHIVVEQLISHTHLLSNYPTTRGSEALLEAIAGWLNRRYQLKNTIDSLTQAITVNGTREALFAFAQCMIDRSKPNALVMMPNPFYQIYEGAALLAGATPVFMNCSEENNFLPDVDAISDQQWQDCQLIYICNPGNPTGAVMPVEYLQKLIKLAHKHDFIIASDECYSEIYSDESLAPPGLLAAADSLGIVDYQRCVVFHSLSKRSNLPGLRSGFVAGDASILKQFLLYRTYHGCAMSPMTQSASISAWNDEKHVIENRNQYRLKFDTVIKLLSGKMPLLRPDAGFYLWAKTPIPDTDFAQQLYAQQNITVLPGQYLSRTVDGFNPGTNYVRMALVAPVDECRDAAIRIREFYSTLE